MPFSEEENLKLIIARMDSAQDALKSLYDACKGNDQYAIQGAMDKAMDHFKGHTFVALYQGKDKPWFMYHI